MKVLVVPESNSLSHLAKALAVSHALVAGNHCVEIAASPAHAAMLERLGTPCHRLPSLVDVNGAGYPTVEWYSDVTAIDRVIRCECKIIERVAPDRVIGIFRSTLKTACELQCVPLDTLLCGCMLERAQLGLGFHEWEPGATRQRGLIASFFGWAARNLSVARRSLGLEGISDIRSQLQGENTFLWDYPEFVSLSDTTGLTYIGPLTYDGWPYDSFDLYRMIGEGKKRLAVISFGTCSASATYFEKAIRILRAMDMRVIVTNSRTAGYANRWKDDPNVLFVGFVPLPRILEEADFLITHGGQMSVFEALNANTPVAVLPFQPEQAHNGICLSQVGCGGNLIPSCLFAGNPDTYVNAFAEEDEKTIIQFLERLQRSSVAESMKRQRRYMSRCVGPAAIVSALEEQ